MTPTRILAQIPDRLLSRSPSQAGQLSTARRLVGWLEHAGYRPSFAELEDERARRATSTSTRRESE